MRYIALEQALDECLNIKDAIQSEALDPRLDGAALHPLGSESWSKRLMQSDKISIDKELQPQPQTQTPRGASHPRVIEQPRLLWFEVS
ncbi:hypothetical protein CSIM01_05828 [Colletotrichum simmondsii]|uniref:Uncharacterized protein n=1 Tax=Colletotrichum simmondsii TaxID=703756 RepID=A0A135S8C6_9PEZI|nr:hypothetical protein CSIM01_05828 [Colletotrichum simmondsii]